MKKHISIVAGVMVFLGLSVSVMAANVVPQRTFTLEELKTFDGKEGRPAYIAVNGIVYDQTQVPAWKTGGHKGARAGTDISAFIVKAPHGLAVLNEKRAVGRLVSVNAVPALKAKKK